MAVDATASEATSRKPRVVGVDITRGVALLGMMAVHSFDTFTGDGAPSPATMIAAGRSAATFVFVAGVSLAFVSGGRTVVQGHQRTAAAAGIAVRGLFVGLLGLALAYLDSGVDIILAAYGLMFLLAIPLLARSPRTLAGITAGLIIVGPVLLVATAGSINVTHGSADPSLGMLLTSPRELLALLLVTGGYPVVVYMAYLCAGIAVGRLDLTSRRVAGWLLGGGLTLAAAAQAGAWLLLYPLGGLDKLTALDPGSAVTSRQQLLWEPERLPSWWYLALPSPHANTPFDLAHTLGSAMAILGAALLLTRMQVLARALRPIAVLGGMTLTLYTGHLILLASGVLEDNALGLYLLMAGTALVFAMTWARHHEQGPLERLIAQIASRTRRAVADRLTPMTTQNT
ncbi:MAG TPA: heparan-alpha-glucosaminide N-acetyltransferase domain-containing protein [Kineosporiaceae bacterium]|nr:heparan-alpha-glucosaminide N-acetyltransferase domain-containing protein [Kineosporiaceae bacterium]